jgi:CheY-like chemotaxis protein
LFERLSVLIVDDSPFSAKVLTEVFRALHIDRISKAKDGKEAVGLLRSFKHSMTAGMAAYDIILLDYRMPSVNGAMVLRWIRQSPESPDRFQPVIMMSAVAETATVAEARDCGVYEFLAKPFSVKAVTDKLIEVIDNPRPFMHTKDYFGPDRRRQNRQIDITERRTATAADVEVIYSGKKANPQNKQAKVFRYELPNRLAAKIKGMSREPIVIDASILAAAEAQLDRMDNDYSEWVKGSLVQLNEAFEKCAAETDFIRRARFAPTMCQIAHELRGQGTTFGYPLITEFARSLFHVTLKLESIDNLLLELLKTHIDGITLVIREKIRGSAGETGALLYTGLQKAQQKFAHARAEGSDASDDAMPEEARAEDSGEEPAEGASEETAEEAVDEPLDQSAEESEDDSGAAGENDEPAESDQTEEVDEAKKTPAQT